MLHAILFFVLAGVAVAAAANLLAQKHPINSALSLIVVMGALASLYLLLGAEFVAAIQIIVYAGAIMVLFVFVIMLLNAGEEEHTRRSRIAWMLGYPAVAALAALVTWTLLHYEFAGQTVTLGGFLSGKGSGSTRDVANLLFRDYLLPFEVTSVLILIAILGAVLLARKGEA